MPDENENNIAISELDEALDLTDSAQFPYTQNNGGTLTTFKARLTQIAAKIIEGLSFAGINLPTSAGDKTVENSINFLLDSVGGDPNGNISDSYDPTAAYVKGDLCIYENVLYICTAPTTGTFDPSNWTATTIDSVIGSLSTLTTTEKSSIVGAVNEVDADKADKATTIAGYGITNAYTKNEVDNNNARRYTTIWGTSCQTTIGRAQFIVLTNRVLYVVWLASTNDINVANVSSNTYQSGTGSVTLDSNVFTRLSNSNLKVQLPGSGTITIFG